MIKYIKIVINKVDFFYMKKLYIMTRKIKKHLDHLRNMYEQNEAPKSMSDKQFFLQMKEETTPIYILLREWEKASLEAVKSNNINVHPHQIVSTKENIELLLLHSYYIDARRKRYMELNHSSHYILDKLLKEIKNKGET